VVVGQQGVYTMQVVEVVVVEGGGVLCLQLVAVVVGPPLDYSWVESDQARLLPSHPVVAVAVAQAVGGVEGVAAQVVGGVEEELEGVSRP